jgi:hypothetical protein
MLRRTQRFLLQQVPVLVASNRSHLASRHDGNERELSKKPSYGRSLSLHGDAPQIQSDMFTLREARGRYFEANGIPADGGYNDAWVNVGFGAITISFPNVSSRRAAVPYHDAHHTLADYDATLRGEAEIAAWEIGSRGCRHHLEAWYVNLHATAIGLIVAPCRTFHAFVRGRYCTNLYGEPIDDALLDTPLREVRRRLGLLDPPRRPAAADGLRFAVWSATALVVAASTLMLAPALAVGFVVLGKRHAAAHRTN